MKGDPNVGSSSSAIKKRKKTSNVWDEMREYPDTDGKVKAECNHCKKTFDADSKKGTTHLKNHLQRCPAKRKSGSDGRDRDDQHQSLSPSIKTKDSARLIKETSVSGLIEHFSLQLVYCPIGKDPEILLKVNYIDHSWERQSKTIRFWQRPRDHIENFTEAVKQSCMDWKIDTNICSSVVFSFNFRTADGLYDEIRKMESLFSQRRSLPFAGCLITILDLWHYVDSVLHSEDYVGDRVRSLKECAAYVQNKSPSDKLIPLKDGPSVWGFCGYFEAAVGVKEVFSALEQFDSEFRSINLSKQKWDEVTATFKHLKFLRDVIDNFCEAPIIVDLPYVHKKLKDRCNHTIEDCLICQKVMKGAIDLFFSKHYSVRVIAVILDPRLKMDGVRLHYKKIYGSDADRYIEKVNKDFRDVYDAYAATDSSSSKSYRMLDATSSPKSELDLYMKELKVPATQQFDILAWWRGNAPIYPTLARIARDYLALEIKYGGYIPHSL